MAKLFQPTVVIGLGGTGKSVLLALKKMIAENSKNGMADYPFLQLLCIDTDISVPSNKSAIETISESELMLDKEKETFSLKVDFNVIPDLKKDFPEIGSWFPERMRPMLNPSEMTRGAGQKKALGRFSFAWNAQNLYTRLQNILSNPVPVGVANTRGVGDNLSDFTNVFICGSVCGGTGAGTFLDTAYLVRYIASTLTRPIYIYGMLALSSLFEGIQGDAQIKPNCYASMMELDHFMNPINNLNSLRSFKPAYKNFSLNYSQATDKGPFDFPFLFDKTNSSGFSFDNPTQFGEMVARFIYLLTGHEVAESWQSMDNNVRKSLDNDYIYEKFNKPNNYRAMGAYSVMFPRRMTVQLCAYRLAQQYFTIMNDDSYNPQEIANKAEYFLNGIKMNPKPEYDQLEKLFNSYNDGETTLDFTDFIEAQKDNILEDEIDKKEIVSRVRQWKEDMDKKLNEFKAQNSVTARNVRERFMSELMKFISENVDLKTSKDVANKTPSGEARVVRGSILRTEKVLLELITQYQDSVEVFRKKANGCEANIQDRLDGFESSIDDLEKVANSVLSSKGKLSETIENTLNECIAYLTEKRLSLVYGWIGQLLTGILENNVQKYPGIIAELEKQQKNLHEGQTKFTSLNEEITKTLNERKFFTGHSLCDILFDYEKDVEGTYKSVLENLTEEDVYTTISANLKKNAFGDSYEKISELSPSSILRYILKSTEEFFFEPVEKISISDKIIENERAKERLVNGNYYKNAERYIGLDGGQLDVVNVNLSKTTFSAITIPDEYAACYCKDLKGALASNSGKLKCPVDANPDEYRDKPCPKYGKCLKKLILDSANVNLAIVPTDESAEVNVFNTTAGFPLHASSTLIYNCKPVYNDLKKKYENSDEEQIHMFGKLKFIDLMEKTENTKDIVEKFKENLFMALCVGRLVIQKASVDYVTQADLNMGNRDKPSVHLGTKLEDVYRCAESTMAADIETVSLIEKEMGIIKERISTDAKIKDEFAQKLKKSFEELRRETPEGLTNKDFEIINKISQDLCGQTLIDNQTTDVLW